MNDRHVLTVYHFSPLDDDAEKLAFDTVEEMEDYMKTLSGSGASCLYYTETALPFRDGWEELLKSSHKVFD